MPAVMAVRRAEFHTLVRETPFLALPREEIDRLHAAIEIHAVDDEALSRDTEFLALHTDIAIHRNYSWLTFRDPDDRRTLLLSAALPAEEPAPLFLGAELVDAARRSVDERLGLSGGCEVRLAGILQVAGVQQPLLGVGLLLIARLNGPATHARAERYGNVDLRQARSEFEPRSQVVIDHLQAL
jgi:hypothetical protein